MIYLDHHASTPCDPEVVAEMAPYFTDFPANPNGETQAHIKIQHSIEEAREKVAKVLGCSAAEIVFTSGATEAINLQLMGFAFANRSRGNHLISSSIEHKAVINTMTYLKSRGFEVDFVDPDSMGRVDVKKVEACLKENTILASFMWANNEVGSINPMKELSALFQNKGVAFHTDATQAPAHLELNLSEMGIAMACFSGHKIYGPKGIGVMYVRRRPRVRLEKLSLGGGQEKGLKSGTQNVPGILGVARAFENAQVNRERDFKKLAGLRDWLKNQLTQHVPKVAIHSPDSELLPNNLNISFIDLKVPSLIPYLGDRFVLSSGSACNSSHQEASHVLQKLGIPHQQALSAIRIGLGKQNSQAELEHFVCAVKELCQKYS